VAFDRLVADVERAAVWQRRGVAEQVGVDVRPLARRLVGHVRLRDLRDLWLWCAGGVLLQPRADDNILGEPVSGGREPADLGVILGGVGRDALLEVTLERVAFAGDETCDVVLGGVDLVDERDREPALVRG
jgi:hypothetical protein